MTTSLQPLVLTHSQRNSLAKVLPHFSDRLELNSRSPRAVEFDKTELQTIRQHVAAAIESISNGSKKGSLRRILTSVDSLLGVDHGKSSEIPINQRVYQFRITLCETKPPIWRRIQVQDGTLEQLHEHIQTSMGWANAHLHQFEINEQRYMEPEMLTGDFPRKQGLDTSATSIRSIIPEGGQRFSFRYEYDFGDDWQHEILFEGYMLADPSVQYPICLEGERACPPEDVGGVWGYFECLEALSDPTHEEHDDYRDWCGPFDPEAFDAKQATRAMRRGLTKK